MLVCGFFNLGKLFDFLNLFSQPFPEQARTLFKLFHL